jgi:hypothetical protein
MVPVRSTVATTCDWKTVGRWLNTPTDSLDVVTTKVADLAAPHDHGSVASDLRQSVFMGGASQIDVACSRAF